MWCYGGLRETDDGLGTQNTEKMNALQTCGVYKERVFRTEKSIPSVLASFPGSGNTWARLLLEFSSGVYTGSVYDDIDLMRLMPAEGLDSVQQPTSTAEAHDSEQKLPTASRNVGTPICEPPRLGVKCK